METNLHHGIPVSRGGLNGSNKRVWEVEKHMAYHALFDNSLPHEAMAYLLMVHINCFKEEFRERLMEILASEPTDIYNESLYRDAELLELPDAIRNKFLPLFDERKAG